MKSRYLRPIIAIFVLVLASIVCGADLPYPATPTWEAEWISETSP